MGYLRNPTIDPDPCHLVKRPVHTSKFVFKRVSEGDLCKIMSDMEPKISCSLACVSNVLLKRLISVTKLPLCVLFNRSLEEGVFPDLMKLAKIIPLHKGGEKMNAITTDLPHCYR